MRSMCCCKLQLICGVHHISSSSSSFERCHIQFGHKHWNVDNVNATTVTKKSNDFVGSWEKAHKSLNRRQWGRINKKKTIYSIIMLFSSSCHAREKSVLEQYAHTHSLTKTKKNDSQGKNHCESIGGGEDGKSQLEKIGGGFIVWLFMFGLPYR